MVPTPENGVRATQDDAGRKSPHASTLDRMALLYDAELTPGKTELLRAWLPRTSFYTGTASAVERIGSFRFDDPDGEVGIETHLVRDADGVVYQVPWTYRAAPLHGARPAGEMEHSVLGHRYVYDATTDPVYVRQLLETIVGGGREADQYVHVDDGAPRQAVGTASVRGSGADGIEIPVVDAVRAVDDDGRTVIETGAVRVVVHHRPAGIDLPGPVLTGVWDGGRGVLASLS